MNSFVAHAPILDNVASSTHNEASQGRLRVDEDSRDACKRKLRQAASNGADGLGAATNTDADQKSGSEDWNRDKIEIVVREVRAPVRLARLEGLQVYTRLVSADSSGERESGDPGGSGRSGGASRSFDTSRFGRLSPRRRNHHLPRESRIPQRARVRARPTSGVHVPLAAVPRGPRPRFVVIDPCGSTPTTPPTSCASISASPSSGGRGLRGARALHDPAPPRKPTVNLLAPIGVGLLEEGRPGAPPRDKVRGADRTSPRAPE